MTTYKIISNTPTTDKYGTAVGVTYGTHKDQILNLERTNGKELDVP
jgi:hypothetical protein